MASIIISIFDDELIGINELKSRLYGLKSVEWIEIKSYSPATAGELDSFKTNIAKKYKDFSKEKIIRCFIICPLYKKFAGLAFIKLSKCINETYRELTNIPFELNGVFILPSVDASIEDKAFAYATLKEIDHRNSCSNTFENGNNYLSDFFWICEFNEKNIIIEKLYYAIITDAQITFNINARNSVLKNTFLQKGCFYSTFDVYLLVFPCENLIEFLKNRLIVDLLDYSLLKTLKISSQKIQSLTNEFQENFKNYNIEERIAEIKEKRLDIDVIQLIEAFEKKGFEAVDEFIHEIYNKVDILLENIRERVVERDIRNYTDIFHKTLKCKTEEIMDDPDRGLCLSYAFLSYILGREDLYEGLKEVHDLCVDNTYNLNTILTGSVKNDVINILKADLDEIIKKLMGIYDKYKKPGIIVKMERTPIDILYDIESIIDFSNFSNEDRERAETLKNIREEVLYSLKKVDELLYDSNKWATLFKSLEVLVKEKAKEKLSELKVLKEQMERAYSRLQAHRQKRKPLICGRRRYEKILRELERIYESLKNKYNDGKKELSFIIIERKNFIFHQKLILAFFEQLMSVAMSFREEIGTFINALIGLKKRSSVPENFDDYESACSYSVVKPEHIPFFYLKEGEIADVIKDFYKFLHGDYHPKLSIYYLKPEDFIQKMQEFSHFCFLKLRDLSIEEVMYRLNNCHEALSSMNSFFCNRSFIKRFQPEDRVTSMLFIGVENKNQTMLEDKACISSIQGDYEFYSTKEKHIISGLKVTHGFTLFALENIRDLKNSYLKILEGDDEITILEEYKSFGDLIPEELG